MSHAEMELSWRYILWKKGDRSKVVIAPVMAENTVLRIHLLINFSAGKRGKNQCKGGLKTVFNDEISDLVKNLWCIFIKPDHKCPHYTYFTIMERFDAVRIFICPIGKLVHVIYSYPGEGLKSYVHSYTT